MPKNTGGDSHRHRIECGPFREARSIGGDFGKPHGWWQRFRAWLFREMY